jgi:hypothetical protein
VNERPLQPTTTYGLVVPEVNERPSQPNTSYVLVVPEVNESPLQPITTNELHNYLHEKRNENPRE